MLWMMKLLCSVLLLLSAVVGFSACSAFAGTPIRGYPNCRYLPTVEECQFYADRIEDYCLRQCVLQQCRFGKPVCDDSAQLQCPLRTGMQLEGQVGGYVPGGKQNCLQPKPEINWCELPVSPPCQALMAVHEFAHSCGWEHGYGLGVPGDKDGRLRCR